MQNHFWGAGLPHSSNSPLPWASPTAIYRTSSTSPSKTPRKTKGSDTDFERIDYFLKHFFKNASWYHASERWNCKNHNFYNDLQSFCQQKWLRRWHSTRSVSKWRPRAFHGRPAQPSCSTIEWSRVCASIFHWNLQCLALPGSFESNGQESML